MEVCDTHKGFLTAKDDYCPQCNYLDVRDDVTDIIKLCLTSIGELEADKFTIGKFKVFREGVMQINEKWSGRY